MATWKNFERRVARMFGVERAPLSGGNGRVTRSDSLHPLLFISCKHSKRSSIWSLFTQEKQKAVAEDKTTLLALHLKGAHGVIFAFHSDDFERIALMYLLSNNICTYSDGAVTIHPTDLDEYELTRLVTDCRYSLDKEED